jgi:single-stranded-DNA-specific exonuclease
MEEGYGLNEGALRNLAQQGIKLVVTVDCGVRSIAEADLARSIGLDLIITDHHTPDKRLPAATAVIDPKREDDPYPYKQLAGVGLAFKLAQALLRVEGQVPVPGRGSLPVEEDWLDLVALGTVADLVPLTGENRALVCRGLEQLRQARRPGIAAMLREASLLPQSVDAYVIGFVLGPRLNAAGRLENASASYELLTTSSAEVAAKLADRLGAQNRERQQLLMQGVDRARKQVREQGDQRVYVLADEAYLVGLVGLVASRIMEEFHRPTVVIALEEEQSRGSARSISAFHITGALDECHELMERHGGHAAAAGLVIKNQNIDALRSALLDIASRELTARDLVPSLKIDWDQPLTSANGETLRQLEALRPFGIGNPPPVFLSRDVQVREVRTIGTDHPGLKLKLSDGRAVWDAVAFQGITREQLTPRIDVAYTLQSRVWNGQRRLELTVKDLRRAASV